MNSPVLTAIVILPFLAAIGLAFVPVKFRFVMRLVALATTLLVALLSVALFWRFATDTEGENTSRDSRLLRCSAGCKPAIRQITSQLCSARKTLAAFCLSLPARNERG